MPATVRSEKGNPSRLLAAERFHEDGSSKFGGRTIKVSSGKLARASLLEELAKFLLANSLALSVMLAARGALE